MTNKTTSFKLLAAAGVALALTACGGGGDGEGDGGGVVVGQNGTVDVNSVAMSPGETCGIGGFAQALLAEINAARSKARKCGSTAMPAVPAIGYWNTALQTAAKAHSMDRVAVKGRGHTGSDGSEPHDRAASAGYSGGVQEILVTATGSMATGMSVQLAVKTWLSSEGHCQAIMNPSVVEMGASCVRSGSFASMTALFGYGQ